MVRRLFRTVDGVEAPVHRLDNGTAVLPVGTTSVACTLTGLAAESDVHLAVWTVGPEDREPLGVRAGDHLGGGRAGRAAGHLALPLRHRLHRAQPHRAAERLGRRDRVDGRTSARGAHLYVAPALLALTVLTFYPVIYGMWLS